MSHIEFIKVMDHWLNARGYINNADDDYIYEYLLFREHTYGEVCFNNYTGTNVSDIAVTWYYDQKIHNPRNVFNPTEELKLIRQETINFILCY
jgi:hypothetical protein